MATAHHSLPFGVAGAGASAPPLQCTAPLAFPRLLPHHRRGVVALHGSRRRRPRSLISYATGDGAEGGAAGGGVVEQAAPSAVSSSGGGDDGIFSSVINGLFFLAFVALTILTIGVIYLAVQDFLQKREKDKYEKEESGKKKGGKKGKGKGAVRARAGPRGFGQKVDDATEDEN